MNAKDISQAKDPDLRASAAAMGRAADLARKTAIQTGTDLILMKDGKLTRIPGANFVGTRGLETSVIPLPPDPT